MSTGKLIHAMLIPLLLLLVYHVHTQETANKKILRTSDWSPNGKYIAVGGDLDSLNLKYRAMGYPLGE